MKFEHNSGRRASVGSRDRYKAGYLRDFQTPTILILERLTKFPSTTTIRVIRLKMPIVRARSFPT